jgi:hypothetical protein
MEGLTDIKILSQGAYSVKDHKLPAQLFGNRVPDHRLDTGAYLIVTVLLSLGLWAAVTSLFSASL